MYPDGLRHKESLISALFTEIKETETGKGKKDDRQGRKTRLLR
jgi:hypothetical protein